MTLNGTDGDHRAMVLVTRDGPWSAGPVVYWKEIATGVGRRDGGDEEERACAVRWWGAGGTR
jgi:hypothetical protein